MNLSSSINVLCFALIFIYTVKSTHESDHVPISRDNGVGSESDLTQSQAPVITYTATEFKSDDKINLDNLQPLPSDDNDQIKRQSLREDLQTNDNKQLEDEKIIKEESQNIELKKVYKEDKSQATEREKLKKERDIEFDHIGSEIFGSKKHVHTEELLSKKSKIALSLLKDAELESLMKAKPTLSDIEWEAKLSRPFGNHYVALNVIVRPGAKNCYFYEPITDFEVDFHVLKGPSLEIGLVIIDPSGNPIAYREPVQESSVPVTVTKEFRMRPFAVCLDNRKTTFGEKRVFISMDLQIDWMDPSPEELEIIKTISLKTDSNTKGVDKHIDNLDRLLLSIETIQSRIHRASRLQRRSNNKATIDRSLMENNLYRVSSWSAFQMCVMIIVAILQTVLIRSLFNESSGFYNLWFKRTSRVRC